MADTYTDDPRAASPNPRCATPLRHQVDSPDMADDSRFQRWFSDGVPHNHALGIVVVEVGKATARFKLPYAAALVGNPDNGVLHGGAITSLLDGVSGASVFAALTSLAPIATLDLRIDYLRPADAGRDVLAHATCYKVTRNVAFTRAIAYHDDEADPIASAVGTFMLATRPGGAARPAGTP
jgi:uncharacterized protein (TIGR00369 family)